MLQDDAFHTLVNDTSLPLDTRVRIRQAAQEHAGDFQNIIPYSADLELANCDLLPQWWHYYGLPQRALLNGACCRTTCHTHSPATFLNWSAEERTEFESGVHSLTCGAGGESVKGPDSNPRKARHNGQNRKVVGRVYVMSGWVFSDREFQPHYADPAAEGRRLDGLASSNYDANGGKDEGVDTTVVCPLARTNVTEAAATDSDWCTREAEKAKRTKHGSLVDLSYLTAAFTTLGGWGREFVNKRVKPYWKAELKKEMADGGTGWNTQRAKRLFFQRAAVVLARGNANMIKQAMSPAARIGRMGA